MTEYIKAVHELEIDIECALSDYARTGDMRYVLEADHWNHRLQELRSTYND